VKKKISIVLPHLQGGGVQRMRIHLANEFINKGFKVEFILFQECGELLDLVPNDAKIFDLNSDRLIKGLFPLVKYLNKQKPDAVLAAMWPLTVITILACFLCKTRPRVIISDHSTLSESSLYRKGINSFLIRITMILTYPFADQIIGVSDGVVEDLRKLTGLSLPQASTIYNPAAPSKETVNNYKRNANLWKNKKVKKIIAIGRLKPAKDYPTLIRAFDVVRRSINAELLILGKGPERKEIELLINELNLKEYVHLPGFKKHQFAYLKGADLFVLSSAWEGFGNVIVESLACGIPVVSTDCKSGPAEILQYGKYGRLVPVGDHKTLAYAILEELDKEHDPEILKQRASDFTVDKIAAQYLCLLFPKYNPQNK
jgi:glycosyltransferase involved in cell wall biosynthesis